MRAYKIITENENYVIYADNLSDAEAQVIREYFPEVLDDDLPDAMERVEIVQL